MPTTQGSPPTWRTFTLLAALAIAACVALLCASRAPVVLYQAF